MRPPQRDAAGPRGRARKRLGAVASFLACSIFLWSFPAIGAASTWTGALAPGSNGESQASTAPAAPTGVAATCVLLQPKVTVGWNPVALATGYTVEESTTSSSSGYTTAATGVATTSWTSGALAAGTYWFEVIANTGISWASPSSAPTGQRTITLGLLCL